MVSFNRVVLAGNLTRDPELRFTQEGVPVANFSIAVNRVRSKSEAVDFFNVSCWRELGERVANYKKKGDPIVVEGHLQNRSWQTPDGTKRSAVEVVANNVQFLSLRFNHKGFAMDVKLIAKPLAFVLFAASGSRLDGRVAFRSARKAPFGPPGRPTAGFRRLRRCAQLRQKRRNYPMDPHRCQSTGLVASLPRQPQVRNAGARQP